ncbi:MAG: valyl-tRNA synthetase [Thermoproteota archaeon]|nr:valyl-tRNA synthetase [Thermoproteota archaeon]
MYDKTEEEDYEAARYTLYTVLWNTTRILAPICPHITEEIYQTLFKGKAETIHGIEWPEIEGIPNDIDAKNQGFIIIDALTKIRGEKARTGVPLSAPLENIRIVAPNKDITILKENEEEVKQILHIKEVEYIEGQNLEIKI